MPIARIEEARTVHGDGKEDLMAKAKSKSKSTSTRARSKARKTAKSPARGKAKSKSKPKPKSKSTAKTKSTAKSARRGKTAAKRELIAPRGDKRYVRRSTRGRFSESDDQTRSLSTDRRRKAKKKAKR